MQHKCNLPLSIKSSLGGNAPEATTQNPWCSYTVPNIMCCHTCVFWFWSEVCMIPVAACGSEEVVLSMMGEGEERFLEHCK